MADDATMYRLRLAMLQAAQEYIDSSDVGTETVTVQSTHFTIRVAKDGVTYIHRDGTVLHQGRLTTYKIPQGDSTPA